MVFNSIAVPTLAATNVTVTTTNAASLYIAGGPANGTNNTITNSYGLWNVGNERLDGFKRFTGTTASISNTTGILLLAGGIGISNTTDAVSATNGGTFTSAGGGAFAKSLFVGTGTNLATVSGITTIGSSTAATISAAGVLTVNNTTASTSNSTGSIIVSGGIGISNATNATSATNGGSFTTAGGMGVAQKLFVGTDLAALGVTTLGSSTALTISYCKQCN
jgi:hypothetical protein